MHSAHNKLTSILYPLKSKVRGFTLIELLVVIAIIGILTGGAIVSYNDFNKAQTVKRSALGLVSDIRETQVRAVAGVKDEACKVDLNDDNIEDYQLGGHYLTFDVAGGVPTSTYTRTQFCVETPGQSAFPLLITPSIDTFTLNTPIEIFDVDCSTLFSHQVTINFLPLNDVEMFHNATDPPTWVTPCNILPMNPVTIKIRDPYTGTIYHINVDAAGQVSQCGPI